MQNLQNYKRRGNKFKKVREVMKIDRKDLEELQIKFKGIIVVLLIHAKDRMVPKDH